jgi:hypothetical protein|tara:strand:+ start:340 stop:549 length:210 start_codon:yes stop_codon:yes gene_type:complete
MLREKLLEALKKRYEGQIAEGFATINIYLQNPVGIGEHPQHLDEMDKLLQKIVDAEEKLSLIKKGEWSK